MIKLLAIKEKNLMYLNFCFSIVLVVMALIFEELYPFTISPMFRDNQYIYSKYLIFDSSGKFIPDYDLSLHQLYNGNPTGLGVGQKPSLTYNEYGKILSKDEIISIITIQKNKNLKFPLKIEQIVYGPIKGTTRYDIIKKNTQIINGQ